MIATLVWLVTAQFAAYALSWLLCAVLMREERTVMLHWAAFMFAAGCGFWLKAQRGAEAQWWPYVGTNLAFMAGSVLLWRGISLFLGRKGIGHEQAWTLVLVVLVAMAIGPSHELAPWRVLWTFGALAWITLRSVTTSLPSALARFGWRTIAWSLVLAAMMMTSHVVAIASQLADMSRPYDPRISNDTAHQLLGYLVAAAAFNLSFMGMSLGSLLGRLRNMAHSDLLTGLANRRTLDQAVQREWALWQRHGRPFVLMMVDIDHFKRVNDTHGHHTGDRVLTEVSRRLRLAMRATDIVGRWGGEEFLVLSPSASEDDAAVAAERLRQVVAAEAIEVDGGWLQVSVSVGFALARSTDADAAAVLARADAALYDAKAQGRNRAVGADAARTSDDADQGLGAPARPGLVHRPRRA